MMRDIRQHFIDILDSIDKIHTFLEGHDLKSFSGDEKTQYAVVRGLEIIGEAAARISEATRARNPTIPWPQMIGMRNRLVHVYFDVDRDLVWDTVTLDLPVLTEELKKILETEPVT